MTTFEITIIVLLVAIVLPLMWLIVLTRNNYRLNQTKELKRQQQVESLLSHLKTMRERSILLLSISDRLEIHSDNCNKRLAELTDTVNKMHRNLCVEIADKMVDRIYPDKESINKIDWDKLSKEQQDEFLKRLILPNYDNPFQPPFNPTCEKQITRTNYDKKGG